MQRDFNELTYVVGDSDRVAAMVELPALAPFSDSVIDFLACVSGKLLKSGKTFSDVMTFAFWCRKAALLHEKTRYDDKELRLGLGVAFHSTPANVPVNFAFSLAAGLLAGNANIVRLPGKDFEQVSLICQVINEALCELPEMESYISLVKYPSVREISDYFSSFCNVRIVWGGDATVMRMRQSPLPPRARELTFADRQSLLLINAEAVLNAENISKLARDFYNDTYITDQNACTSPYIIIWFGKERQRARGVFWKAVSSLKEQYSLAPAQAVGKLAAFYRISTQKKVKLVSGEGNFVTRVAVNSLDADLPSFKYNSGFFLEYDAEKLSEILPLCSIKCQTVTYFGVSQQEINSFIKYYAPKGIDRVVQIGHSMDFSLIWDGHDLIREMSRIINIQ